VQDFQIIGGPSWVKSDRFDIEARAAAGSVRPSTIPVAVPDDVALMLQSLLEDRFKLKLHRETRGFPEYTVRITKNGPRLSAVAPPPPPEPRSTSPRTDVKPLPGSIGFEGAGRLRAAAVQVSKLVSVLSDQLRRPVIDQTGLTGFYDFALDF